MSDFHRLEEVPDWFTDMVDGGLVNEVLNAMVVTLDYTGQSLDEDGSIAVSIAGQDIAIVFEIPDPDEEGNFGRAIFAIPPAGAAALCEMILQRFPAGLVRNLAARAMSQPAEQVMPETNVATEGAMPGAVPMSEEGRKWNADRTARRNGENSE